MEATRGALRTSISAPVDCVALRTVDVTRPARPSIEPKIGPVVRGATKRARPVASVLRWSPLENETATLGVRRPLTSRTARVARSPETSWRGRSRILAPEEAGAAGASAAWALGLGLEG